MRGAKITRTNSYVTILLKFLYFFFICKWYFNVANISEEVRIIIGIISNQGFYTVLIMILIIKKYKKKFLIIYLVTTVLVFLFYGSFIISFLLVVYVSIFVVEYDQEFFNKNVISILSIFLLVHFALYFVGIIDDNPIGVGSKYRQSLGFLSVNTLSYILFFLFCHSILYKKKVFSILSFSIFIVAVISSLYTKSKTSIILYLLFYFASLIINGKVQKLKIVRLLIYCYFGVISLLTYYLGLNYERFMALNYFLSNRLYFWNRFLITRNKTSFLHANNDISSYNPIDSSFIYILYGGSIFVFIFINILFFLTVKKLLENREFTALVILLLLFLYSFMENNLFYAVLNPVFYILISSISRRSLGNIPNYTNI